MKLDFSKFSYGSGWGKDDFDVLRLPLKEDERYRYLEVLGYTFVSRVSPEYQLRITNGMRVAVFSEDDLDFLSDRLKRRDDFEHRKDPYNTSVDVSFRPRKVVPDKMQFNYDSARIRNPNFMYYHLNLLPAMGPIEEGHLLNGVIPQCVSRTRKDNMRSGRHLMFKTSNYNVYQNVGLVLSNNKIPFLSSYRYLYRGNRQRSKRCDVYSFLLFKPSRLKQYVEKEDFPRFYSDICDMPDMTSEEAVLYTNMLERQKFFDAAKVEGRFGRTEFDELKEVKRFLRKEQSELEKAMELHKKGGKRLVLEAKYAECDRRLEEISERVSKLNAIHGSKYPKKKRYFNYKERRALEDFKAEGMEEFRRS